MSGKAILKEIGSTLLYIVVVLGITWLVITFVGQRTEVNGSSMEPTLSNNDNLIVDKISYRFKDPQRFDIIVFPFQYDENVYYIKRIIGLPGDKVKLEDGRYVCELADDVHAVDAFGHKALTGTARYLANVVARNLDTKTRCIELSTLQRCAGHLTSRTDITEAYQVGGAAAKAAFEGVTGQMVALKRISNSPYQCTTELHPISEVANLEKKVPLSWMNANHTQMTDEFLAYARPLIQAELTPLYIAGLPHHIYMKNQK